MLFDTASISDSFRKGVVSNLVKEVNALTGAINTTAVKDSAALQTALSVLADAEKGLDAAKSAFDNAKLAVCAFAAASLAPPVQIHRTRVCA